MKVAHLSDLHFAPEHLEEVDRCMSAAVQEITQMAEIDAVVISGDATDHRIDLHSPSAQRLAAHIRALAEKAPVLMLQGTFSHEPTGTLDVFRHIRGRFPVYVASEIHQVALTQTGEWLSSLGQEVPDYVFNDHLPKGSKAVFSCLPTVNKASMVAALGIDDHTAIGEVLAQLLAGFAPANHMARKNDLPTIGISHGTVNGCITEHGVPMLGFDHEFTVGSLFSAQCSAFLLGHIHKHQQWKTPDEKRVIAYAGSIARLHYGEEGDKGWLLWDVDAENAQCVQHVTPSRKLVHIDFDHEPDIDAIREAVASEPGAFVRVRYSIPEDQRHSIDRELIAKVVEQAGGLQCKIEGRVIPVTRVRAEGISQSNTLQGKLSHWCDVTHSESSPLVERLNILLDNDDAQTIIDKCMQVRPVEAPFENPVVTEAIPSTPEDAKTDSDAESAPESIPSPQEPAPKVEAVDLLDLF